MSFNDIFKSSFLENVTAVSITDMALALVLSFCLGLRETNWGQFPIQITN